jgi:hypothetical protein
MQLALQLTQNLIEHQRTLPRIQTLKKREGAATVTIQLSCASEAN